MSLRPQARPDRQLVVDRRVVGLRAATLLHRARHYGPQGERAAVARKRRAAQAGAAPRPDGQQFERCAHRRGRVVGRDLSDLRGIARHLRTVGPEHSGHDSSGRPRPGIGEHGSAEARDRPGSVRVPPRSARRDRAAHLRGERNHQGRRRQSPLRGRGNPRHDPATVLETREEIQQGICPASFEYRIIRPDGTMRQVYRENELIRDEAGTPLYLAGTIHDVTERRNTEHQLRQAQKMEAIGNLTGGMAHDFNNLLGIIVGNLDLARERVGSDDELCEIVDEALEATLRGADLTGRLLAFARRQPLRPVRIDVNKLVSDTMRLMRRLLGEDIEISLELAETIWPVTADPAQLEASLANLATNARDAMPKGGRLIITTANRRLDADYAAAHADVAEGDFVMIEVSDTGTGMSAEIISQVFDPFFTTKETGKGTGLGLSMVFGFLRQSGGHVNVYSEPDVGTTFRLYLPRMMTEALPREVAEARPVEPAAGETVLVVEDDPAVRRIVLRQLGEFGYRVLECDRAATALELLQREPVDLLLTDIVMPGGLDGIALARMAAERWPALKIVLTSGFPQARVDGNGELLGNMQLLSKPYRRAELAAALRIALAR